MILSEGVSFPMSGVPLAVGQKVVFSKTVSEADVYMYAGITGDLSPNHVNEEYMKKTRYGKRIAHGALLIGFMSTTSTLICQNCERPAVSYGYDRIRFTGPVYIGDTVTVEYKIIQVMESEDKTLSEITVYNQNGNVVAVGTHILKFI